jgi:DNA polymerase-3 subunit delta
VKEAEQILLDMKRRILQPVYFLCGEEPYYVDQISSYAEEHLIDEAEREFNQAVVYGKDVSLTDVLGLARQFPMMGDRRLVIVKEAQNIKELMKGNADQESKAAKKSVTDKAELMVRYLEKPQLETILIFCYKHKTFDKRTRIGKAMQKHAVFLETKSIYESKLPEWISAYVADKHKSISPKAVYLLAEYLGNDLSKIANELEKLFISLKPGEEIDVGHVQEFIGISREYNIFELQEAFSKKDVLKANRIVNYFAANEKDAPFVMLLSTLYGYFTKILKFHHLPDKSKFGAAKALGVNPYFVEGYLSAAQHFGPAKLRQIFSLLKEFDLRSKGLEGNNASEGELLKEMVFRILH